MPSEKTASFIHISYFYICLFESSFQIDKEVQEQFTPTLEKLRIFVYNIYCVIVSVRKERRMKGYLSIRETSYKWGISERRVNQYVAQGRIPGAERFGRSWAIPDDAVKPTDPRKQTPPIPGTNSKTK